MIGQVPQMPPMPTDGNWVPWIIGTLMFALVSTFGWSIVLIKRLEQRYVNDIGERDEVIKSLKAEFLEFRISSNADRKALHEETTKCHQEREILSYKLAKLEGRIERLEPKDDK